MGVPFTGACNTRQMRPEDVPQCARASKGGCVHAPSYDVPIPLPRCLPSARLTATGHLLATKYLRALLVRACDERAEVPQRYSPRMNESRRSTAAPAGADEGRQLLGDQCNARATS